MKPILQALVLATSLTSPAVAGGGGWIADFDQAVELARKQDKDLIVDFTGSDW